jgi:CspA family cold shock protein
MNTGTVKWINDSKGFGLITPDWQGRLRVSGRSAGDASKSLRQKQKVSFEVTADVGGEQAVNIKPIA